MNIISLGFPLLYDFVILGLCTFLLIRGVTHAFICLFAAGTLIELIRSAGFFALSIAPGGFSANSAYLPAISAVGIIGMLIFLGGFLAMTAFFLRPTTPA